MFVLLLLLLFESTVTSKELGDLLFVLYFSFAL